MRRLIARSSSQCGLLGYVSNKPPHRYSPTKPYLSDVLRKISDRSTAYAPASSLDILALFVIRVLVTITCTCAPRLSSKSPAQTSSSPGCATTSNVVVSFLRRIEAPSRRLRSNHWLALAHWTSMEHSLWARSTANMMGPAARSESEKMQLIRARRRRRLRARGSGGGL